MSDFEKESKIYLGNISSEKNTEGSKDNFSDTFSKEEFTLFEKNVCDKEKYYEAFGLKNFQNISESEKEEAKKISVKYTLYAEKIYSTDNDKLDEFKKNCATATQAITTYRGKKNYDTELYKSLLENIANRLELHSPSEREIDFKSATILIDKAFEYGLLSEDDEWNKKFSNDFGEIVEKHGGIISFTQAFEKDIQNRDEKEFIDTQKNRNFVYNLFLKYKRDEAYIRTYKRVDFSLDESLRQEADKIIFNSGKEFIPQIEAFDRYVVLPFMKEDLGKDVLEEEIDKTLYNILQRKALNFGISKEEFDNYLEKKQVTVKPKTQSNLPAIYKSESTKTKNKANIYGIFMKYIPYIFALIIFIFVMRGINSLIHKTNSQSDVVVNYVRTPTAVTKPILEITNQEKVEKTKTSYKSVKKDSVRISKIAGSKKTFTVKNVSFSVHYCPPGSFMMGSSKSEEDRETDEKQHKVTLTRGFWLMETEVTQKLYKAVMGNNPSKSRGFGEMSPVTDVKWYDAESFSRRLSLLTGVDFRLPTEAQWEYACRAGSTTAYYWGKNINGNYAWYKDNSLRETHTVGMKKPNAWGIYDMSGNVWEWCLDWYQKDYPLENTVDPIGPPSGRSKVLRGGCIVSYGKDIRSAERYFRFPNSPIDFTCGFRLVTLE